MNRGRLIYGGFQTWFLQLSDVFASDGPLVIGTIVFGRTQHFALRRAPAEDSGPGVFSNYLENDMDGTSSKRNRGALFAGETPETFMGQQCRLSMLCGSGEAT